MLITNENLKNLAASIGITEIGVTGSALPHYILDRFLKRTEEYPLTKFEDKNIYTRLSPESILPNCQTIITIFLPYQIDQSVEINHKRSLDPRGKVAKCSQGPDYHKVAETKAFDLVNLIKTEANRSFNYLIQCDRNPLPERDLAYCAGLGYTGNNCMLINPRYGSYGILVCILLDQYIEPTNVTNKNSCKTCNLCIEACPTGALVKPYLLNPALCLSYLSQLSGTFPKNLRIQLGNRLYGCDTCQESCPQNKYIEYTNVKEFKTIYFPEEPSLYSIINLTKKEYDRSISLTSAGWRGKTTIQRNAVIALGNNQEERSIPILGNLLSNDTRPVIRLHAAWALSQFNSKKTKDSLEISLKKEQDTAVIKEIITALNQ